ncbi:MAG: hypothetical protein WAK24_22845, partial [Candidatus Acidiferrales bacterium]
DQRYSDGVFIPTVISYGNQRSAMTEKIDSTVGYFLGSQFPILRSQRLEAAAMDVGVQSAQSVIRFFSRD